MNNETGGHDLIESDIWRKVSLAMLLPIKFPAELYRIFHEIACMRDEKLEEMFKEQMSSTFKDQEYCTCEKPNYGQYDDHCVDCGKDIEDFVKQHEHKKT